MAAVGAARGIALPWQWHGRAAAARAEGGVERPALLALAAANYWQNKRTKVSIFERDRTPRPMSFRNCVSSCLRWEGAAPGDVSEENLAKLAEEAKARAQPQVGGE